MSTINTMNSLEEPKRTGDTSMFRANPVLNRLKKEKVRAAGESVTYAGIAMKTSWFLLVTLLGMVAQLLVHAALASEPVWQSVPLYGKFVMTLTKTETLILAGVLIGGLVTQLLGVFVRKTVPVTGSLYSASQGYVISFLVFNVLKGYEYLGLEALLITIAVVAAMSWLYTTGRVKVNGTFRTVLLSLVLGSIAVGVFAFVGSLIPAVRPYVQLLSQNFGVAVTLDVVGILIAALFLISDFDVIDNCVKQKLPKEYEWSAAFGLAFTVIWLYMKVLDLIMRIAGRNKD